MMAAQAIQPVAELVLDNNDSDNRATEVVLGSAEKTMAKMIWMMMSLFDGDAPWQLVKFYC
jgi:hypothetical protein